MFLTRKIAKSRKNVPDFIIIFVRLNLTICFESMKTRILWFVLGIFACITINAQEKSIKIRNTKWASCNLDAEKQSDYGFFFTWEDALKSCPKGWRLPAKKEFDELMKLCNSGIWSTLSSIEGRWFSESGDVQNGLFFPAGGFKEPSSNFVKYQKTCGPCGTSTNFDDSFAFYLYTFAEGSFTT
jgi:uncharacterized protein (TIGR02145 family)